MDWQCLERECMERQSLFVNDVFRMHSAWEFSVNFEVVRRKGDSIHVCTKKFYMRTLEGMGVFLRDMPLPVCFASVSCEHLTERRR